MDELLQKHRTFTLAVAVGGLVFLVALLLRGCAVYNRDLGQARATVDRKAKELTATPVPDEKYLKALDAVVTESDARVAELAREVGRTARGEALWEESIGDVLRLIKQDSPEARKDLMERARKLPSSAFSLLLEKVRTALFARASEADVELASPDLGFDQVNETNFSTSLAALAAVTRILDRTIALGIQRVDQIAVSGATKGVGGTPDEPFLTAQNVRFKLKGDPAALAELLKSVNDRDVNGRRLVLDEVMQLGRPTTVRAGEPGNLEFMVRVYLVNLDAKEEQAP